MVIYFRVLLAATLAAVVYYFVPTSLRAAVPVDAAPLLETFLEVLGGIYSVLTAFVIFVVWEQFNSLQKLTVQEASLAAEVPRLAGLLGEESTEARRKIASATRIYADAAIAEWENLAKLEESRAAIKALDAVEARVVEARPAGDASHAIHDRLIDAVAALRACRMSRVSAAKHRMPPTLSRLIGLLSLLLLAAFLALPSGRDPAIAAIAFACLAGVFAMIRGVVWDMDHPFVGVWNVATAPFEQVGKPT